jgi:hypothetical protein
MSADTTEPVPAPSSAAERMRRYRKRKREAIKFERAGIRHVQLLLDTTDVDALVRLGFLNEADRHDPESLQIAVTDVYWVSQDATVIALRLRRRSP